MESTVTVLADDLKDGTSTRLSFVRHAQSVSNLAEQIRGEDSCTGLTEHGHEQAALLARRLGADHDDDPITALYSTPLARAVQTAQPAAKVLGLEIRHLPAWHYPHYGVADGRTWYEVYAECPIPHPALRPDVPIAEGAETVTAFRASVRTAISEMVRAHPGEHILVFGSFENVLAAHEELLGLPPDSRCRSKIALDHTGITVWDLTPAPWSPAGQRAVLVRHNDSSHLPAPQRRSRFRAAPAVGS